MGSYPSACFRLPPLAAKCRQKQKTTDKVAFAYRIIHAVKRYSLNSALFVVGIADGIVPARDLGDRKLPQASLGQ